MKFELPPLPYNLEALEPVVSKQTLSFHYGKHEQAYINNLNGLIIGTPFETMSLEEIVKTSEGAIFNNAAQAWNHIFYFNSFAPNPPKGPKDPDKPSSPRRPIPWAACCCLHGLHPARPPPRCIPPPGRWRRIWAGGRNGRCCR